MKFLVTGASGFIGTALCAKLLARGDSVTALNASGGTLADGSSIQAIDLSREPVAAELLRGVDVVFHLAGIAHQNAAETQYQLLNREATLKLARAASLAGVECFVFLSSVKAMGASKGALPRGEQDCCPPTDAYGLSKWQAECDLRAAFADARMAVRIVRPALVYGTEPKGNLQLLAKGLEWGLPRPHEEGGRSMIALEDLTELLIQLPPDDGGGVKTWIATDGQSYSTRRVYDVLRRYSGRATGRSWWPRWMWKLAATCLDVIRRPPEPTWEKLFGTELYSNERICVDLGWQPSAAIEDIFSPRNSEQAR